jgi:hypothetical protein
MDSSVIDKAVEGKYTEFSREIKKELYKRMAAADVSMEYAREYDKIHSMKRDFSDICGDEE